jgi:acetyl-CoA C-acetyltransferase
MTRANSALPVIVGVAQTVDRSAGVVEPVDQMTEVSAGALSDVGVTIDPDSIDIIGVVGGLWEYTDPARLVADRVGATKARTLLSGFGGETPQSLLAHFAERINSEELDVAVVVGAEAVASRRKLRAQGTKMAVTDQNGAMPDERFKPEIDVATDYETELGLIMPVLTYAIVEVAIRHARAESVDAHLSRIAQMCSNMSAIAVENPYAWHQQRLSAAEIAAVSPKNRLVGYPYTRRMNAEPSVDMAAAIVLMSDSRSDELGVEPARRVYPHRIIEAVDTPSITLRGRLDDSQALRAISRRWGAESLPSVGDLSLIDLYSCFPSIVSISSDIFGIDEEGPLSVTGGLHFGGGPLNNSVTHTIATLVDGLRNEPGGFGMVHGNGGLITKHSVGAYSTTPPERFELIDVQDDVDTSFDRTPQPSDAEGAFTLEAYTVMHDRDGPTKAMGALLDDSGRRGWASATDDDTFGALMNDDLVGTAVHRSADGLLSL